MQVYPINIKDHTRKIWNQKGYEHATDEEKTKYPKLIYERKCLQSNISAYDKQLQHMEKQLIPQSLSRMAHGNKVHKQPKILYAKTPIIDLDEKYRTRKPAIREYCGRLTLTTTTIPNRPQGDAQSIVSFNTHKYMRTTHEQKHDCSLHSKNQAKEKPNTQ